MIAAYALVLQVFLAYSIASQAAAQDPSLSGGAFFVICSSQHDAEGTAGTDIPAQPNTHCPICTLSMVTAAFLPDPPAVPLRHGRLVQQSLFISAEACLSFHRARAGLSRAPPQAV